MDEDTWADPAVAALVERSAVAIRVDADARPDVYARYHVGGLPTTALLTPDGRFVKGATYLSPTEVQRWLQLALEECRAGRVPAQRAGPIPYAPDDLVADVAARLLARADAEHGGFGAAPKLPETAALTLLLRVWRKSRETHVERIVRRSLDALLTNLADPRDGGFFRYAAGADWSGPHTEKVALDQAQIAQLMLEAGMALGEPRFVDAARTTLAHARHRLADRDGRVLASVAADPIYYGSDPSRAAEMVAADETRGAEPAPEVEPMPGTSMMPDARAMPGTNAILDGDAAQGASLTPDTDAIPDSAAMRATDEMPPVDGRRFADGGAAMVSAGALFMAITDTDLGFRSEFREAAPSGCVPHRLDRADRAGEVAQAGDLLQSGWRGPDRTRRTAIEDNRAKAPAVAERAPRELHPRADLSTLEGGAPSSRDTDRPRGVRGLLRDQALAIAASLAEYRIRGDRALLDWSELAARWSLEHLWDEDAAAFRDAPHDTREPVPLPAMFPLIANGEMALALVDLSAHTGRPEYRARAERVVASLGGRALRSPAGSSLALAAQRLRDRPAEAELDGPPGHVDAVTLARAVVAAFGPTAVVRWTGVGAPGVVLCVGDRCLPRFAAPRALLESAVDLGLAPRGILAHRFN